MRRSTAIEIAQIQKLYRARQSSLEISPIHQAPIGPIFRIPYMEGFVACRSSEDKIMLIANDVMEDMLRECHWRHGIAYQ